VMHVESDGKPRARSQKGAMGLMQIMPKTWAELRARYGLGADPYDPSDNILAGTAYIRQLHDRYGAPGFLAAYNAGPGRYERHLATGRPLPAETQAYVARLALVIGSARSNARAITVGTSFAWANSPLFATRSASVAASARSSAGTHLNRSSPLTLLSTCRSSRRSRATCSCVSPGELERNDRYRASSYSIAACRMSGYEAIGTGRSQP
jgi:hypothetical protein